MFDLRDARMRTCKTLCKQRRSLLTEALHTLLAGIGLSRTDSFVT